MEIRAEEISAIIKKQIENYGREIEVSEIDVHGNTPDGKLERLPQYPHVFWMVWSHWYPQTKVMN